MKISYTDSATIELEKFQERQRAILQDIIKERKYVFGDDEIEVTASDVREASDRIRAIPSDYRRKSFFSETISKVYIIVGCIVATGGFAYPYLKALMAEEPFQFMLVSMGVTMMLLGYMLHVIVKSKRKRMERIFRFEHARDELSTLEDTIRNIEANKSE